MKHSSENIVFPISVSVFAHVPGNNVADQNLYPCRKQKCFPRNSKTFG